MNITDVQQPANPLEEERKRKAVAAAKGAVPTVNVDRPAGIASNPPIMINGVPHQNLADQKYPGPLSMAVDAMAGTIGYIATAPFGNRAEERLAANRAELSNDTAEPNRPTKPAAPTGVATGGAQAAANQGIADLSGRQAGFMIENNLREFEDKGSGVVRQVGANGRASFTNVDTGNITDPAKTIAVNTYDGAADNASLAKANAIRQQMIDRQPVGGVAILGDGGIEAANAEKTSRWAADDLQDSIKRASSRSERSALGQALAATIAGQTQRDTEAIRQQGIAGGLQIQARGQDMQAQTEANRLAGNPVDLQLKSAQVHGIAAQTETTKALGELQRKAIAGDATAIATLQAINGKRQAASDRFLTVQGGEEVGPDNIKIKRPGGVFDAQTQRFVPMDGQQSGPTQAPAAAIDYLKKNPSQAEAFKAKYGYLPQGF